MVRTKVRETPGFFAQLQREKTARVGTVVLETVQSQSRPGQSYEIRLSKDGSHTYCTCPAWRFQSLPPRERTCKHLKARAARMRRAA